MRLIYAFPAIRMIRLARFDLYRSERLHRDGERPPRSRRFGWLRSQQPERACRRRPQCGVGWGTRPPS